MQLIFRIISTKKKELLSLEWTIFFSSFFCTILKHCNTDALHCLFLVFIMTWSQALFNPLLTPAAFFQKCIFFYILEAK